MKKFYFLFFLLFLSRFHFAQAVSSHPLENKIKHWQIISNNASLSRDTVVLKQKLTELAMSKAVVDQVLYHALLGKGYSNIFDGLNKAGDRHFKASIKKAKKLKDPAIIIWAELCYGDYLYKYRDMTSALPIFMDASSQIEKINPDKMLFPGNSFKKIGYYMGTIGDSPEAISYLKKALDFTENNTSDYAEFLDNIGLYYMASHDYTNAESYFSKASVIAKDIKDDIRYAKTLGNLGRIQEVRGNLKAAIQLLQRDISISENLGADQNTMFAYTVLTRMLLKDNQLKEAEEAALKAEVIAKTKHYFQNTELEIIKLKLEIYVQQNRPVEELAARRKMKILEDSLKYKDGDLALSQAKLMAQKTRYRYQIEKADAELKRESLITKIALAIAGIGLFLLLFNFFYSKKREGRRQTIFEARIGAHEQEKVLYEEKLERAQQTLRSQVEYLKKKNFHIQQLTSEIEEIRNSGFSHLEEEHGKLHEILESHLMTEQNWQMFRREFQKEYPDFYQTLKTEFPEVTPANLRIILLQKMGFSSSEIASLLGITQDAVKKSRQRLKRKLGDKYDQLFSIVFSES